MNNFWKEKAGNIYSLAPMEDVTDTVFREIVLSVSDADYLNVLYTEFTNVDGMCHPVGRDKVSHRLKVSESERILLKEKDVKLVAQIWGSDPEKFAQTTRMLNDEWQFDGIDINMGCPVKKIVKQAACSALIAFPDLAKEIIYAVKENTTLPVSVKTRTGLSFHDTENWISNILETKPEAVILHARTQKMMSDFPAEWDEIGKAVNIKNSLSKDTIIIGNGDIFTVDDARRLMNEQKCDGVMVGRGIFRNPWIFNPAKNPDPVERLNLLWKHASLFTSYWKEDMNFNILKRFFKIYSTGFYGAAELRAKLMETNNIDDVYQVLKGIPEIELNLK